MVSQTFMLALLAGLATAMPVMQPKNLNQGIAKRGNFETDPMLQVGEEQSSSYATSEKRSNFETDPMLQVGEVDVSSYAGARKRDNFRTDPMLQVGETDESSYAGSY